jgi:hypothetical protein
LVIGPLTPEYPCSITLGTLGILGILGTLTTSPLPLLVAGICANNPHRAFAFDDFALVTYFLDGRSYLHDDTSSLRGPAAVKNKCQNSKLKRRSKL